MFRTVANKEPRCRVMFVTTGLGLGGAETILYLLASYLLKRGADCVVVTFDSGGYYGEKLEDLGIEVIRLVNWDLSRWRFIRSGLRVFSAITLCRVLYKYRPDLVHTWLYPADIIGGLAAKLVGIPAIWGIYTGVTEKKYYKTLTYMMLRLCVRLSTTVPSHIISCSAFARRTHSKLGYPAAAISFVPTGFHVPDELQTRNTGTVNSELSTREFKVGMLGRMSLEKDQGLLIRSVARAIERGYNIKLVLAGGDGVSKKNCNLTEVIEKYGITSNVELLGVVENSNEFLSKLDLFALISRSEGFPTVVGEAMAAGLPCMVSDIGDSRILLGDKQQLVDVGSSEQITDRLEFWINSGKSKCDEVGVRNIKRIRELFTLEKMFGRYESIYKNYLKTSQ